MQPLTYFPLESGHTSNPTNFPALLNHTIVIKWPG